jgi:hypothetical protein
MKASAQERVIIGCKIAYRNECPRRPVVASQRIQNARDDHHTMRRQLIKATSLTRSLIDGTIR